MEKGQTAILIFVWFNSEFEIQMMISDQDF